MTDEIHGVVEEAAANPSHMNEVLKLALDMGRDMTKTAQYPEGHACRELSLAVTKIEEAIHWLRSAPCYWDNPDGS
jgi:pantothenate kinase